MSGAFPILFVTSSRIGDAVLSSGLLKRLHDEIPNATFTIAAGAASAPLFRDMDRLERVITVEKRKNGLHWLQLWGEVRSRRWGFVLDMRGSGLAGFLSAKKRRVYRSPGDDAPVLHKVVEAAKLLELQDEPPSPYLFVSDETQATADALLGEGSGPILAVGPGAKWVGKTWPAERFNEVCARLLGPDGPLEGGRLVILGAAADRDAAHTVRMATARERVIDLTGKVDLLTAYAVLKRSRLYLGNDSGLMHLAAASGCPTLGLFGPSDDRKYGAWGPDARVVRGHRVFEDFLKVDPELNQALNHMLDLQVDVVLDAATKLIADTEPTGA